jgi:hypothetical protein
MDIGKGMYYSSYEILARKYSVGFAGTFKQTSKYLLAREILNGSDSFVLQDHTGDAVFDTSEMDFHKLCLSCVLYTRDIKKGVSSTTLNTIQNTLVGVLGKIPLAEKTVQCWNSEQLKFAIMYVLTNCSPNHGYHFTITRLLLTEFLGSGGYGNRGYVFGTDNIWQCTNTCGTNYAQVESLIKKYTIVPAECVALIPAVECLNCTVADARLVETDRNNLRKFVVDFCGIADSDYLDLLEILREARIKRSPVSMTAEVIRNLTQRYYMPVNIIKIFHRIADGTFSKCHHCWLKEHGYGGCKQHRKIVPTASPVSELECRICLSVQIDTRLNPCGHTYCKGCSQGVNLCPHCRSKIVSRDRIYIA